jgi:polyisoprenoid-binding protein YceI
MLTVLFAAALAAIVPATVPPGALARAVRPALPVTWRIDATHSELSFRIRHWVSRVRGTFRDWSGTIAADTANLGAGSVQVEIRTASIFTDNERRDTHLRSPDFFAADSFPTITFTSTRVERSGSDLRVTGSLTIRGVTRTVTLTGTYNGVQPMGQGGARIGFEFQTRINRLDYGVRWNRAAEVGGVMLGDDVDIVITIEAVAQN